MNKIFIIFVALFCITSFSYAGSMTSGSVTLGGSDTQVQFNNAGAFGGDSDMTFVSGTTLNLDILNRFSNKQ